MNRNTKIFCVVLLLVLLIISINSSALYSQSINNNLGRKTINISDSYNYKTSSKSNLTNFSIAFLPAFVIPEDRSFSEYSVGYGFNINLSYMLSEDIKISGNIETIFSDFIMENLLNGRLNYETKSLWLGAEIGAKLYLNRGFSRIFLNTHFKYTQIYHGSGDINISQINNPDNTLGFNFGFGVEIPLSNYLTFEVSPTFNYLYPISRDQHFDTSSGYYKILIGLIHNFKI
jgi:hypothetical protein